MSTAFWAVSSFDDISRACENLRDREGSPRSRDIHYTIGGALRTCGDGEADPRSADVAEIVKEWLDVITDLDAAVWTGLPPKGFTRLDPASLAVDVVEYLRGLSGEEQRRAKEYAQFAPSTIQTPVRNAIEQSPLRWSPKQLPGHLFDVGT